MTELPSAQKTAAHKTAAHKTAVRNRRGLSTGWLLIWSPVFLLAVLLIVEVGNVFLAKVQLENALEAAALAAVKRWRDTGSTDSARDYAVSYAFANKVSGVPVVLDRNDGGPPPNGNLSCDGDIVLGAVLVPDGVDEFDCSQFIFDANETPGVGGSNLRVSLNVWVHTTYDTLNDAATGNYSFQIFDYSASNTDLTISSVTFNVATVPGANDEPAFFDLRDPPGNGVGNDRRSGIEPIFLGTGVSNTTPSLTLADDTTAPTYTIFFNGTGSDAFEPGTLGSPSTDRFDFSVDTDSVGPDLGTGDNRAADDGGDFAGATVTVSFQLNGVDAGTITGVLRYINPELAVLEFFEERVSTGNYGVRTKRAMPVRPICASMFGMPLPTFQVCGEAAAFIRGLNGSPRLFHIDQFECD